MRNKYFDVAFDASNGTISSLKLAEDSNSMNWCSESGCWGYVHNLKKDSPWGDYEKRQIPMKLIKFEENDYFSKSIYSNTVLQVTAERFFDDNDYLRERFTFKNLFCAELFLNEGCCSIEVPLNDQYTSADDCMINRCNANIWCGLNTTYIDALRMGVSDLNLGLVVTSGSFDSYSTTDCKGNARGRFLLNLSHVELSQNEEYVIEWVIFPHSGKKNFREKALSYKSFIDISAKHYTLFKGESLNFCVRFKSIPDSIKVYDNNGNIPFKISDNCIYVESETSTLGERRIYIEADNLITYCDFLIKEDFETILKKRISFIVEKQQFLKAGSTLDGAFLIYDNQKQHLVFDNFVTDHNANRERTGMALLIARYLRTHKNEKFYKAILKYDEFINREIYDDQTGYVYNSIGKDPTTIRLYNAPWVSMFFTEMYYLTKDKKYLEKVLKLFRNYYQIGGQKFYPNGIAVLMTANAFKDAQMHDAYNDIYAMFTTHINNMVKNGTSYPKHEVNYEQTIVSPAATFISEYAVLSNDSMYVDEAKKHIDNLVRFSENQPSFHMNEIPIRYWDDYWFGNFMLRGDNFPHYWSCLSARSYMEYYKASGCKEYFEKANECMRNCLCLFTDDGYGSAAYIYPYKVNDKFDNEAFGEVYDNWANDQDFALYFALATGVFE